MWAIAHKWLGWFGALCCVACLTASAQSNAQSDLLANGDLRGMTLGLHSKDYTYDYITLLKEIETPEAEWLSLNVKFYQDLIHSTQIQFFEDGHPFWQQLEQTIQQAKDLDFKVLLFPIVLIENAKNGEWRGKLKPKSKEEWYDSYGNLMEKLAKLAAKHQVDLFSVGSEFCSLEKDEEHWNKLIDRIKKYYDGPLTYSVNWDALEDIRFWQRLDILGMTGYFSLTRKKDPSVEDLVKAWECIKGDIFKISEERDIPIMFSELGYTSQNGINKDPWNYYISEELDLEEQKDCFEAFTQTWLKETALSGVFFYDWFGIGGHCDLTYTVKDKPALEVVKQWFEH